MRFYDYFRSSAGYRCRIALNLKSLSPERLNVHLRKGEQREPAYLALNPQGMVPALAVEGSLIGQSLAIIEWLEETYPKPPLLPEAPLARARIRALALAIACDIHPLHNLRVLQHLKRQLGQEQTGLDAWCRHWIQTGLGAIEAQLAAEGADAPFLGGAQPGLADLCLVPQLFAANRFGTDLSGLARLNAIAENCAALPAFAAAHPSRQPDFEA